MAFQDIWTNLFISRHWKTS